MSEQRWLGPNNEYPYTRAMLRRDFPGIAFPDRLESSVMKRFGIYPATEAPKPDIDERREKLRPGDFVPKGEGFERQWVVEPLTRQEITQRQKTLALSRLKMRLALIDAGLWDKVQPAIDSVADPTERAILQAYFDDAPAWPRTAPWVKAIARAMKLTEAELDDIYRAAA